MYRCQYFAIHELVPRAVAFARGEAAWELLDDRLLITSDRLRQRFGKMTVNNYHWGGDREWSGLRTPVSPYFSQYSQHTFGRAADCLFADATADEVRADILAHPELPAFELIGGIELDVSWLHFDVRNTDRIKTFGQGG